MSPGLTIAAGNGQVTAQNLNTAVPLTVQAADASGRPIANLPLTWTVTQGQGTIVYPPSRTDSNGMATAPFRGDVTPGYSFSQQTVTVSSSLGSVNFMITTVLGSLSSGERAAMPSALLTTPPIENRAITGKSGSTIPDAIEVVVGVVSGPQQGAAIPNVGVRIIDGQDPTLPPEAQCAGTPVTDQKGIVRCDLMLTAPPGRYSISVEVGEFVSTPPIQLTITGGSSCTYAVSATAQQFSSAGGIGTITVNTQNGCSWTVLNNTSWITTNNTGGTGYGGTGFTLSGNSGSARSGTITIAGQTLTISQAGGSSSPQPLSIVTQPSLSAVVGVAYTGSLAATGGRPPYSWTVNGTLPPGLTLNPTTGAITGTPSAAGTFSVPIILTDQSGATQNQTFTFAVQTGGSSGGGNGPTITNNGFPNASAGVPYQQLLTSTGSCAGPFSPAPVFTLASGTLPAGLSIVKLDDRRYALAGTPTTTGVYNFTLTVTDFCNASGSGNFTLTVTGTSSAPGPVSAAPSSLTFYWVAGQANPADQTINLSGPSNTLFNLSAVTQSGGSWLSIVGQTFGTFPAGVTIRASNLDSLSPGNYTGAISVISNAGVFSVPVTVTVSGPAAALAVAPPAINATVQASGAAIQQLLSVTNPSGPAHFTIVASTANGGSWLTVSGAPGFQSNTVVQADTPANLTILLNPTGLPPALYYGSIQLIPNRPVGNPIIIPVNFHVLPAPGLAVSAGSLSFTSQALQTPAPAQPLTITSTGLPVDVAVAAATSSGGNWLTVTPQLGTTPLTVAASVNAAGLPPGTYAGSITVSSGTQGVTPVLIAVTLTVPQGGPAIAVVVNAASFQPGPVSPGEIVTIFGTGFGPVALAPSHLNSQGALDSLIGDTRVYFDGIAAPLIYSVLGQLSAIVPYEVAAEATTQVRVEYQGVQSAPLAVNVAASAPAIFTWAASGHGPAAALNEDATYNTQANGAEPGSIVVLYATGEGQTDPGGVDGLLANSVYPAPLLHVAVSVAGQDSTVLYAGAAPGLAAGLMQVNLRLPQNLTRGSAVPVILTVGDAQSQGGVTIFTKP